MKERQEHPTAQIAPPDPPRRARDYRAMDLHRLIEYSKLEEMTGRHRIAQEIASAQPTDVVLDVGCAFGEWANVYLAGRAARAVGVDIDREDVGRAVDYARRALPSNTRPAFAVTSAHDLPFPDGAYTLVYLMDVLEHVDRPDRTAEEVQRVLAPGGRLVVSVPGDWLFNWLDPHYPEHRHYSQAQLKAFFPALEAMAVHQTGFLWATIWGKYIRFLCTRAMRLVPGRQRRAAALRRTSNTIAQIADLDCRLNYGFGAALCIVFRKP